MTIQDAINRCDSIGREDICETFGDAYSQFHLFSSEEYSQVSWWLTELKILRMLVGAIDRKDSESEKVARDLLAKKQEMDSLLG